MPTFREDLHLGHKVPVIEGDDIANGTITFNKLSEEALQRILDYVCEHCPGHRNKVFDFTFDATFA